MEEINNHDFAGLVEVSLDLVKRQLFNSHTTKEKREAKHAEIIANLDWYLKMRSYLESNDREEDLSREYFENKERYRQIALDYSLVDENFLPNYDLGHFQALVQSVKGLSTISAEDLPEEFR